MQPQATTRPALGVLSQRVRACVRLCVRVHAGGRVRRGRGRERARYKIYSRRFSMLEQNLEKGVVSKGKLVLTNLMQAVEYKRKYCF